MNKILAPPQNQGDEAQFGSPPQNGSPGPRAHPPGGSNANGAEGPQVNNRPGTQGKPDQEVTPQKQINLGDPNSFWYGLKQQILKAWQPVPTIRSTMLIFLILSIYFIAMGIILLINTLDVVEVSRRYDTVCNVNTGGPCAVSFIPPSDMKAPIFMYYQMENYYQNHRLYMQSKSESQLEGEEVSLSDVESVCDPVNTVGDLGFSPDTYNPDNSLTNTSIANPCGLLPRSMFNDSYQLYDGNRNIDVASTGIAWPADRGGKYKQYSNPREQWIDVTNERFLVWMRTAAFPSFRKLWGRIGEDMYSNTTYTVYIQDNYNVTRFGGTKSVYFSTTNAFGGKNMFLAIAYLVVGAAGFLIFLIFLVKKLFFPSKFKEIEDKTK